MKKILLVLLVLGTVSMMSACSSKDESPYYDYPYNDQNEDPNEDQNGESYEEIAEAPFIRTEDMQVSTFSADVDTASYSNVRRFLNDNQLPPVDSVRIEELVNYFNYDLALPTEGNIFGITTEIHSAPWNAEHDLLMIGLKTEEIEYNLTAGSNIVFLLDTSGSMGNSDKLPLLQTAMKLLVNQLRPQDRITIVTYAGSALLALDGADGSDREEIISAIDGLYASGSTNGSAGIQLAYEKALQYFIEGGVNRVILGTDGDLNVGASSQEALKELIEEKRESGVFFSVLGFGTGNLQDSKMETLADSGNGVYYYIDSVLEAKKVFVTELGGSLITVAKDVKLQVEFNPLYVKAYRLIGYENRTLNNEDFTNNEVDAGDIGAGHEVIAFYEIIRQSSNEEIDPLDFNEVTDLKYDGELFEDEIMTLKINFKDPISNMDQSATHIQTNTTTEMSDTFNFASAVVEYGLLLRHSAYKGDSNYDNVMNRALTSLESDIEGYRAEFIDLVIKAKALGE